MKRPITFEDLMRMDRVSNIAVHPDGKLVAYVTSKHDHIENKVRKCIRLLYLQSGRSRKLTPCQNSNSMPAWSPDGKFLAFASDRGKCGDLPKEEHNQIWIMPFADGGESYQLTSGEGGAGQPVWSPDGKHIIFSRQVIVSPHWDGPIEKCECGEDKSEERHAKTYGLINSKSTGRIENSLLFRHWDHWRDMKRNHIFIVKIETKDMIDATPGDSDSPPLGLDGSLDYEISPDGNELVFVKNPDPVVALSTNNSIFIQRLENGKPVGEPKNISATKAVDIGPKYSPDGKLLAYLGAQRPTYEADKLQIKLFNRATGETSYPTKDFDRSAAEYLWTEDSKAIYFLAQDAGRVSVYKLNIEDNSIVQITRGSMNLCLKSIPGSKDLLLLRDATHKPSDIYRLSPGEGFPPIFKRGSGPEVSNDNIEQLTHTSDWMGEELEMNPAEDLWYEGAEGTPIHGFMIKPPGFDPAKKYKTILIIHGGPQSAFLNNFHYRWCAQLFASEGYVIIMFNPRGSTGYGQKFTDQICGDWGGRCYTDIMKGVDHCIKTYPFIDKDRIAAAGASFGGFMINWIEGHTDRFKVLISHDGIFNAETMAYMTEELWFELWEHGGMPHDKRESFQKFSPHMHVANFKTPCLVIQGEQDFRCPVSEGITMFTALQTMEVPSKLLYFSDEGHWVLSPANSQVWYRTIQDFIQEHIG